MSIESSKLMREFIAHKRDLVERDVVFVNVSASPGMRYSEYTEEGFDCWIRYRYRGEDQTIILDAQETCEMLNEIFPDSNE